MTPPPDTDTGAGVGQPISFRARPELAGQLAERDKRRGTAARRDLSRYYAWLAEELAGVQLAEDDADQLLLALRELVDQPGGPRLWAWTPVLPAHRYIVTELERRAPATDAAAAVARAWTPGQARAALDATERAWRLLDPDPDQKARIAALGRVGLLRDG